MKLRGFHEFVFIFALVHTFMVRAYVSSLSDLGSYFWVYFAILMIGMVYGIIEIIGVVKESRMEKRKLALAYKHGEIYSDMVPLRYQFTYPFKMIAQITRDHRMGIERKSYPLEPRSPIKRSIVKLASKLPCSCEKAHIC